MLSEFSREHHLFRLCSQWLAFVNYNWIFCACLPFPFPLLRGDCGRRGWYDCPQSALRPRTVWPNAPATPDVCKLVCEWMLCDSARYRCILCRRELVAINFIVHGVGRLFSQGAGRVYATPRATEHIPARSRGSLMHTVPDVVHTWPNTYQCRRSALITTQAPLFLSVMTCRSLERTQTNPLYLFENLTACPFMHGC